MALIKCKECKKEVSSTAKKCPNCGASVVSAHNALKGVLALVVMIPIFFMFFGGGIEKKVAMDQIKEYEIVKKNGSAIDKCVHAGVVVAAFAQAKDEQGYKKWKGIQSKDCAAAGMPNF